MRQDVEDVSGFDIDDGQSMNAMLDQKSDRFEETTIRINADERPTVAHKLICNNTNTI